ncbi:MAG: hypothetical protein K2G31_03840, partial [Clostridia bacterium]|nr:hypothetical protein [Clostridia bacterium]
MNYEVIKEKKMTADKTLEVYEKLDKKPYDIIRNEFIQDYGPNVLQNLEGIKLAERLFAGKDAESDLGIRGLFVWLEHGKSGKVPKGTFGYARDSAFQNGILL